jgi:hypothetical protein
MLLRAFAHGGVDAGAVRLSAKVDALGLQGQDSLLASLDNGKYVHPYLSLA